MFTDKQIEAPSFAPEIHATEISDSWIYALTHSYERILIVLVALLPIFAIAYIYLFQDPSILFVNHGSHEIAIFLAITQSSFVNYVTWRCYVSSGEPLLRWLTLSFIGFTLVYGLHGIFTPLSSDHMALFLLYGPASRFVMAACLLAGLFVYGKPHHLLQKRIQKRFWLVWIAGFLALDIIVGWIALSMSSSVQAIRMGMEEGAFLLILAGIAYIFLRKISSWMMVVYTISLAYLALSSLTFLLAKPWNHLWWLAHIISAGGFTILSYGVIRAFHTTRAFSLVFSQEEILKQLAVARAASEEHALHLKNILDNLFACVVLLDINGVVKEVNQGPLKRAGIAREDLIGQHFYDVTWWSHDEKVRSQLIEAIKAAAHGYIRRYDVVVKMGEDFVPIDFRISPVTNESGRIVSLLTIGVDITERKKAEEELRIAATVFKSQEGMIITDANSVIQQVNPAFTEITGYTAEEAIGQMPSLLKSGRQDAAFYAAMWESIRCNGAWRGEIWNRRKNGEEYPERLTITAVNGEDGKTTHYVATLHDITERKAAEAQIYNLAFYDALTQLPNRRLLNDRLGQAMAASKRSGRYGALMFLDLDDFKPLNDTHGHSVGDLLLIEAARRISSCVRETDTVTRFGGDEFVVMLSELDQDRAESIAQAGIVAEKIRSTLAAPYLLTIQQEGKVKNSVEHHCTSSIGVVMFLNHATSVDDIIKSADKAMYQAKDSGRNLIRFYDSQA